MSLTKWESFHDDSKKLTKPASVKQILLKKDIDEIKILITDVLIQFLKKQDLHIGLKTYINKELRNDLIDKMVSNPPKLDESLKNWSSQIFGKEKFGIILIGLEQYSNAFAEKAAKVVRPLLEIAGLPLDGLSFLFFMGNYGFTPFGVHKDATGEDGVLFHLGPANKQFYTWDDPKYNSIEHHSKVFHNVEEMQKEGEKYELEPGDAMFIPHYVYHVANTPEFSLSFVLDYINPPKDRFENELIKEAAEENLTHHKTFENPVNLNAASVSLKKIIDLESIKAKMEITLSRKITRLKSNGGIRRKSNKVNVTFPNTENFALKSKSIFPLYLEEIDKERILLYARGHTIHLKQNSKLSQLIHQLNNGEVLPLKNIQEKLIPYWDLQDVFGFIQELLNVEAITVNEF